MPNPKQYKNQSHWMKDCFYKIVEEEKKDKEQGIAICLNMWRDRHKKAMRITHRFLMANYYHPNS